MLPLQPRVDLVPSIRQLATRLGVSHTALLRAEKDKRIHPLGAGPYDVAAYRAAFDANTKRTRRRAAQMETAPAGPETIPATGGNPPGDRGVERVEVPAEATAAVVETLREHGVEVHGGHLTLRDATTAKEIMQAYAARENVDRIRGQKVDRSRVHAVLTTFTRAIRDDLMRWPKAIAPMIARDLGLSDHHPLELALETHLRVRLEVAARVPPPEQLLPATTPP